MPIRESWPSWHLPRGCTPLDSTHELHDLSHWIRIFKCVTEVDEIHPKLFGSSRQGFHRGFRISVQRWYNGPGWQNCRFTSVGQFQCLNPSNPSIFLQGQSVPHGRMIPNRTSGADYFNAPACWWHPPSHIHKRRSAYVHNTVICEPLPMEYYIFRSQNREAIL